MPQPGDVFVVKNWDFGDGVKKPRPFVVLNSSDLNNPCLTLCATSQSKWYPNCLEGCCKDNKRFSCFFVPLIWGHNTFMLDTYIEIPKIIPFPASQLLADGFAGKIDFKNPLPQNRFAQLIMCLSSFRDDILDHHWEMIHKKAH